MKQIGKMLYKMDSKQRIRVWSISVSNSGICPIYSVSHGQLDGKMQVTEVEVPKGKNIGRANETSAEAQCLSEAEALYQKQIARKGYSESIPSEVPSLPMLAHKYKDFAHKINWPAIVVRKYDGLRVVISIKNGKVSCVSRTGKEFIGFEHITDELLKLNKDVVIDGELYSDIHQFEEITSIVRKTKIQDLRVRDIYLVAFDLINSDTYHQRVLSLDNLVRGLQFTKAASWYIVKDDAAVKLKHDKFLSEGYEGTMVRNMDAKYQQNKRSYDLLKFKNFEDNEFEIIGYKSGVGKFKNVPTFQLKTDEGFIFEAVPKGNEEMRLEYLKNANSYIGKFATVKYFEYTNTKTPVPRFPIIINMNRENT